MKLRSIVQWVMNHEVAYRPCFNCGMFLYRVFDFGIFIFKGRTMTTLGWKVKTAREAKGISQQELGKKLGYSSGQLISNVERGIIPFPVRKFKALARFTGIDKRELVEAYADDARQYARKFI